MSKTRVLLCAVLLLCVSMFYMPVTQAADINPDKMVIFVQNSSKEASPNDIATIATRIATVYTLPKYFVVSGAFAEPMGSDRASLEKFATEANADDVIYVDIKQFSAILRGNEDMEDINVQLNLVYLNKKANMYGTIMGDPAARAKKPSPFHGALQESLRMLQAMLPKLDPVFPR